jgi:Ser/Thr protein kinase RdoA (MazF antagonist)
MSSVLSASETQAAEALLGTPVRSAEPIWERNWILRLTLADGRTVILKRDRDSQDDVVSFTAERAALTFLGGMDPPVAPRLLGSTDGLLLMEDLGPAVSLADSLLLRPDGDRATADLFAYARAYGAMHAWSAGRRDEFAACCPDDVPQPHWITLIARGREPLLSVASRLGLASAGVRAELVSLGELLRGPGDAYTGLVRSDACPDNEQLTGGRCRIFDFETSGWGPFALDAAYVLAPFPSCWCFAVLPSSVADPALAV